MLILVSVTVKTAVNSGLFGHAKNATEKWAKEQEREGKIGAEVDSIIEDYTSGQNIERAGIWRAKKSTEKFSTVVNIEVYSTYCARISNMNEYKEKYIVKGLNKVAKDLGTGEDTINSLDELLAIEDESFEEIYEKDGGREALLTLMLIELGGEIPGNSFTTEEMNSLLPDNFSELSQDDKIRAYKDIYADVGLRILGYTEENITQVEQEYEEYKRNETPMEIPDEIKNETYTITYPDGSTTTVLGSELGTFKDKYRVTRNGTNVIKITASSESYTLTVNVDNYFAKIHKEGSYTYTFSNVLGGYGAKVTDNTLSSYEKPKSDIKGIPVVSWNGMFENCSNLATFSFTGVDSSKVTDMENLFRGCTNLISIDFANINTSNVTDMGYMFIDCKKLNNIDISTFDTSKVKYMTWMFGSCELLKSLDLSNFDTSNVRYMSCMFAYSRSIESLNLSNFDTSNVTNMNNMFMNCEGLTSLDLSSFNTSNVTDMNYMFNGCKSIISLDLSNFDTSKVTKMYSMFSYCSSLQHLNLNSFKTPNLVLMSQKLKQSSGEGYYYYGMFENCTSLTELDLSSFDTNKVTDMQHLFAGCPNLTTIYVGDGWTTENADAEDMFLNCGTDTVTKK